MDRSNKSRIFCFLLLGIIFGATPSAARLREYEESCNAYKATENCRPDLDLICNEDHICVCRDQAFYDSERKACISLIGETCTPEETTYSSYGGSSGYIPTISRCPGNATCVAKDPNKVQALPASLKSYEWAVNNGVSYSNKCFCNQGFYSDEEAEHCVPALRFGDKCSEDLTSQDRICDPMAGLICGTETGTCICNTAATSTIYYDHKISRCATPVGESCNSTTFCEQNSICSTILDIFMSRYNSNMYGGNIPRPKTKRRSGIKNVPTVKRPDTPKKTSVCTCLPGYTMNSIGKCVGSFSVACSTDNPCNENKFLECIDGLCQCQKGAHQIFSSSENASCVSLPGSPCRIGSGPSCFENSHCAIHTENGIDGTCQCDNGYSESPTGKCYIDFEKECTMPSQTNIYGSYAPAAQQEAIPDSCNFYQGLSCVRDRCQCFDSLLKWDSTRRTCTAGENERCGSISMIQTDNYQNEPFYPTSYLNRRAYGFYNYFSSYFVACSAGLTCTKEHKGIEGWNLCEKKKA